MVHMPKVKEEKEKPEKQRDRKGMRVEACRRPPPLSATRTPTVQWKCLSEGFLLSRDGIFAEGKK